MSGTAGLPARDTRTSVESHIHLHHLHQPALLARLIQPKFTAAAAERVKATQAKLGHTFLGNQHTKVVASASVRGPANQGLTPNLLDIPTGKARDQAAKA